MKTVPTCIPIFTDMDADERLHGRVADFAALSALPVPAVLQPTQAGR